MGEKLTTPRARLSYPALFVPTKMEGATEAKYSAVLVFDEAMQATDEFKAMKAAMGQAAKEKWGTKMPSGLRNPFRKSEENDKADAPGYGPGSVFVRCSSKTRPGVVNQKLQAIIDPEDIFPGCWVRATVNAYAFDVSGNRGVAFGLNNLQKLENGPRLGQARTAAEKDFEEVDGDDAAELDAMFS